MTEMTETEALNKMMAYCASAEHCRAELTEKMQRWGLAYDAVNRIADRLENEKFIDEERYCQAFINDKYRFAKWGKVKITFNLREKHLQETDIAEALDIIDEGEYDEMLASLLKSKLQHIKYHFEYEKQGKLYRFAQSRGFENFVIERVLRNL